jgi:monoamine oxidase
VKILVIGAGAAGITAGHLLAKSGVDFEILEASSTHGGRVRKVDDFADFPIDLGAEWIHKWIKAKPAIFKLLLQGADPDFPTFPDKTKTISQWKDGKLRERNWVRFLPVPMDLKFTDSTWFDALDKLVTPELLARTHFDSPVATIEYGTDSVVLTTNAGERHRGDKVLLTVPIAMLQREVIRFDPPLPEGKRAEIQKEEVPGGLKVFIEFSKCFYPDVLNVGNLFRCNALDNCSYYNAAFGKQSKQHVLGFFSQGSKAERYLACGSDDEIFAYVLRELDEIFDGQASEHYVKHIVQDWSREPYIHGSYSQRKANAERLAEPVAGRLYFAGEAMNPNGKTIAVHGACESAYTAVDAMLG